MFSRESAQGRISEIECWDLGGPWGTRAGGGGGAGGKGGGGGGVRSGRKAVGGFTAFLLGRSGENESSRGLVTLAGSPEL